ncbi:hypothetical protein MFRU_025g00100 [Monilinia fructicola]|uniref:Histone-lysine N-methyltransferase SET5 n=2 Tax=Monilinia fructicola TaxID=38448 RepID=A0A5M9J475_MONFR|nr:hypothetical protein EYC84_011984 [Monilinia fructicola]KAG4027943.1 hypothetical protein MFRU_025g00100 [Monilinia fructicola]
MDSPWRPELYKPSSACEIAPHQVLEAELLESEIAELSQFTKDIARTPYDPENWLNRGNCLRRLGYPELALGDVHKSRLLVEAALENDCILGTDAYKAYSQKIYQLHQTHPAWMPRKSQVATPEALQALVSVLLKRLELQIWSELMEGLMASNCCTDYLAVSKDAVTRFPDDQVFPSEVTNAESWFEQRQNILQGYVDDKEMTKETMATTLYNGGVYPTAYPWMTEDLITRSDQLLEKVASEFASASSNCVVSKSTIRLASSPEEISEVDVLGVVATRDIQAQESVLLDPTLAAAVGSVDRCSACCGPLLDEIENSCCSTKYCSSSCSQRALDSYHSVICGKDLNFLYEAKPASSSNSTESSVGSNLLLRVLALSIKENAANPLETSLISRLTPAYNPNDPQLIAFNFKDHIITPIRILRELGIDVFTNSMYDTWVLHTIHCRLQNNKHGQTFDDIRGTAINPLYSMFNHSCDPNVDWRHDDENSTVTMFAERDIKKGEEMFISYIGKGKGLKERQGKLMPWFGMECACHKCDEEKLAAMVTGITV